MYKANIVTTDNLKIIHFTDCISLPEKVVGFINALDNEPDSWKFLTKFEDWYARTDENKKDFSEHYGLEKWAYPRSLGSGNEYIDRKAFYITDTIMCALEFCSNLYEGFTKMPKIEWPTMFKINKWKTGGQMGPHADTYNGTKDFAMSALVYLNNDYEGGELFFPEYNVKVKPGAGSVVMFPSNTIHQALPVTKGEKYFAPFFSV